MNILFIQSTCIVLQFIPYTKQNIRNVLKILRVSCIMVQVQYVILEGDIETMINTTNIFDYEDVQLIPNKCIVSSRSECDTHVKLGKRTFRLPVVPANMQTIIDEELAEKLAREGYFYIMHRFQPQRRILFYFHWCKTRGICFS